MRVEESYYGDYKVMDDFPFTTADIVRAGSVIYKSFGVRTVNWPVTIDFNDKTGYWEVWFTRPVDDATYVAHMENYG